MKKIYKNDLICYDTITDLFASYFLILFFFTLINSYSFINYYTTLQIIK